MTLLKVLLAVLLVLWLISLIRIGGRVRYGQGGLYVFVLAGPLSIQLLSFKSKKKQKMKQDKKLKKEKPTPEENHDKTLAEGRSSTLPRLLQLLPIVGQACGALKRKIRIDDLELQLIWGGSDPAAIALGYGRSNAVLGMLWPLFDNNFKVKRHSFQVDMDYGSTQPAVELQAAVTITVGQMTALSVRYGLKALIAWIKSGRTDRKKQEALSHE